MYLTERERERGGKEEEEKKLLITRLTAIEDGDRSKLSNETNTANCLVNEVKHLIQSQILTQYDNVTRSNVGTDHIKVTKVNHRRKCIVKKRILLGQDLKQYVEKPLQ
ncbi:hypothetical protein LOAG_13407 [Loa loa]|uniref:Uncharacterized protein n=1 Tax=Loa loa TaxID=7209 RepID=A0A1S0TJK2_LOALO|nr:hypothetical protein LOAG_13407 [Loa loa]EFO15107.1 hypothetical protein LOAG_13407 [Loa loa]